MKKKSVITIPLKYGIQVLDYRLSNFRSSTISTNVCTIPIYTGEVLSNFPNSFVRLCLLP